MASKSLTLSIRPRGKPLKKLPEELSLSAGSTSSDLYTQLASAAKTSIHRLRVTKGSDGSLVPSSTSLPVRDTGLRDGSSIYVKDLGPQISWRLVYLIEYLGPLLLHPLLYTLLAPSPPSTSQTLICTLITLHFLKRELETLLLHRFSTATMPLFNVLRNSAHYWLLAGLLIAAEVYRPTSFASLPLNPWITYPSLAAYIVGEAGNLNAHLVLRNLRREGTTERGVPKGWGFGTVTCPNYGFETLAWVGVAGVGWSWATVVFGAVAVSYMGPWAAKREARYRREFGAEYQRKSWLMLPGIY